MHADTKSCGFDPESPYVELAVEVFAMLADATRVRIVLALAAHEELSVNRLAELAGKSSAATSQHLAKLRMARMVRTRQQGTSVLYRLTDEHARRLVADAIFQAEHTVSDAPHHHRTEPAG